MRASYSLKPFRSRRPSPDGYRDLTIRGVTRSVALDAEPISPEIKGLFGEYRRGTRAVGKISRKEFGLKSNTVLEGGALGVGDEVEITLEVEFKRKAQGARPHPQA